MNKIQRLLLIFFAILVLLSYGSSYTKFGTDLELFLAAVLLFFGLSPLTWFCKKQSVQRETTVPENENYEEALKNEDFIPLPFLGFPTSEQSLILKSLIKLRAAEIGSIYCTLRDYQRKVGDGNWVPLFMKKKAVSDLYYAHYVHIETEEEQKAEAEAQDIFEKKYKFCSIAPTDLYENEIADLQVALAYWCSSPKMLIYRLEEIKSFGILGDWIDSLIQQYKLLDQVTAGGDFETIFKKNKDAKSFKFCLDKITSLWSQISRIMKMSIIMNRIKENIENEQSSNEDIDLKEIEALVELERHLDYAITKENSKIRGFALASFEKIEPFFLERLKFNPLWHRYF